MHRSIGTRRELFVHGFLVEKLIGGATRRLHHPVPREIVMRFGDKRKPWEDDIAYVTVVQDQDRILER